jgi:hypothetical protein
VRGRTLGLYLPALFKDVVRRRMPACILAKGEIDGSTKKHRDHRRRILYTVRNSAASLWGILSLFVHTPFPTPLMLVRAHAYYDMSRAGLGKHTRYNTKRGEHKTRARRQLSICPREKWCTCVYNNMR